jgi:RNA polymerase sigma factor (sigma-70 family)
MLRALAAVSTVLVSQYALAFAPSPAVTSSSRFALAPPRHGSTAEGLQRAAQHCSASAVCRAAATAEATRSGMRRNAASSTVDMSSVIAHYGAQPAATPKRGTKAAAAAAAVQFDTLLPAEEKVLLRQVAAANKLTELKKQIENRRGETLTHSEWAAAAKISEETLQQRLSAGVAAKEVLIATNIPLVYSIVYKQYASRVARDGLQVSARDMVQDGVCGLMHAVELYNEAASKGAKLRTYAWYWVKSYIDQGILTNGHAIKVPRRAVENINSAVFKLSAQLQRLPDEEELAQHMNISKVSLIDKLKRSKPRMLSLDTATNDDDDTLDLIDRARREEGSENATEAELEKALIGSAVRRVIGTALTAKERQLLTLRYGLDDGRTRTLSECSKLTALSVRITTNMLEASIQKLRAHILLHDGPLKEYVADGCT